MNILTKIKKGFLQALSIFKKKPRRYSQIYYQHMAQIRREEEEELRKILIEKRDGQVRLTPPPGDSIRATIPPKRIGYKNVRTFKQN